MTTRAGAALLLAVALLAGCSSGGGERPTAAVTPAVVGAAASSSTAAELEAGLTAVLVERVYVQAEAVSSGAPEAVAALDASSASLADVLGAPYTELREPLLAALRVCDAQQVARASLTDCSTRLEAVVRQVVPRLSDDQLDGRLVGAVPTSFAALRTAAGQARGTARVLAGAVAADRRLGSTATPASTLRADLTWLLVEHVRLAVAGPAARDALVANGEALADVAGGLYPAARAPLLKAWNAHLDRLSTWTSALAADDEARAPSLRTAVLRLPAEIGPVLTASVRDLSADRLAQELRPALNALLDAVGAVLLHRTGSAALEQRAVGAVLAPAALVAAAVSEDRHLS